MQSARQKAISLERLGFRREANGLAAPESADDLLLRALVQSIRKRGYEKAFVLLQPLEEGLTKAWLPSENIACGIRTSDADLRGDPKYLLIELDERTGQRPTGLEFANAPPGPTRVAFFGPATIPATAVRGPFVPGPESLDDLVERLDARPATDWADPKPAVRPPS